MRPPKQSLSHHPSSKPARSTLPKLPPTYLQACISAIRCADVGLDPPRDEKVMQLVDKFDSDNSGELDLKEFEKFFEIVLRDAAKKAAKLGRLDSQKKLASVNK